MNTKLTLIGTMAVACATIQLAAMPTEEETKRAEPVVQKLLASERAALKSGKKTRSEVAVEAMKLADKAEADAEKLLLMKGAFVLYAQDGNIEKAAEAMKALKAAIPDIPLQSVTNMVETALLGVSKKEDGARLYKLLDEAHIAALTKDAAPNVEYKFSYKLENGFAILTGIDPKPVGTLVIPDKIDGHKVTSISGSGYNDGSPFWSGCEQMTKIVLPAGLEIPEAFCNCKSLSSIEISKSNKKFASRDGVLYSKDFSTLFAYPKTRESIELSPKTRKVKGCAFRGCALKTAKIPEGIEEVDAWNLCECPDLEWIEFPKSLKYLGQCAACGSGKLKKIVFNGDAPQIGLGQFSWGKQFVFTGAPENLVVEVRRGSKGWLAPDSIELPELWPTSQKESRPIRYMGPEANRQMFSRMFPGWQVSTEAERELAVVSSHRGQDDVAFVHPPSQRRPAVVSSSLTLSNGNPCLFLKMASFDEGSDFLLSVLVNGKEVLPKRLICTPDYAPWQDITIPLSAWRGEKVKIDVVLTANNWWCEHPFFKRLEVAEGTGQEKFVPEAKETYGGYTWSYRVDNGEASIVAEKDGKYSCAVSPSPKGDITIPETLGGVKVTGIGRQIFYRCKEVTSVTIPEGVTSIGPSAFDLCFGLKSVTIPSSVKTIGDFAFSACFRLQSVTMPESLEYIGNAAFINCRSFKVVNIPVKLTVIGDAAFAYCTRLEQFNVDAGNETFIAKDGVLYSKDWSSLVSVPNVSTIAGMPSSVTKIGASAFQGRDRLETLTLPASVTIIDRGAFHDCNRLGSMTVPASVAKIGDGAFFNCGELTEVTMLGERPEAPNDIFNKNCGKLKSIHVPANAKSWTGMKEWQGIPLVFDAEAAESRPEQSRYMVVDLDKSGKDAVTYLDDVPNGGWGDEYRTKKIALRRIEPGSFEYMPGKSFKITKPFYIGVFEVTQKQYEMLMKVNPSEFPGDMRPVEKVCYVDIRGSNKGLNWPKDNQVDADSYLGRLRKRIGVDFDLPTEVQWEYACRAGTKGDFNVDGVELVKLGKYADNDGRRDHHVKVGSFLPNAWGLYDMHGNNWELCLDRSKNRADAWVWFGWNTDLKETDADPKGVAEGASRILRGGSWNDENVLCRSSRRCSVPADHRNWGIGLRLACPADGHAMNLSTDEKPSELKTERAEQGDALQRFRARRMLRKTELQSQNGQIQPAHGERRSLLNRGGSGLLNRGTPSDGGKSSLDSRRERREAEERQAAEQQAAKEAERKRQAEAEAAKQEEEKKSREEERVKARRELAAVQEELRKVREEHKEALRLEAKSIGQEKSVSDVQKTYGGYTWSYRVDNGEATLVAEKDGKYSCAVSPAPKGDINIPATLGGVKVTRIGTEAFRNCDGLTSVTIPEGVTYIDTHALAYCAGLKSVTLPSSLRGIGYGAFGKDAELTSVTIPNGVKSIGADAFNGCGLKSVVIPESVTSIGDRAFCGCRELESVAIPAGVARMGKGVFAECNALKIINVDSGNQSFTSIDGVLYTKDRPELVMYPNPPASVVIPKGVTKIRGWAFAGGKEMTSVTIPEGVTNIGDVAFLDCVGLKSVTIPSSVKKIEEHAFGRCGELTEVAMLGERPEAANEIFKKCGKLKAIHVPANAKSWAGMKEWQGIPLVFDAR